MDDTRVATPAQTGEMFQKPWAALWPNLLARVAFAIALFSFSTRRFRKQ